jgi:ribosomal protein L23
MYKVKPHISEKSVNMSATREFTMVVPFSYTKTKIMCVVREVFSVDPISVRTMNMKSVVSRKAKGYQKQKSFKKAIIKLPEKQTIPGFQAFADELKKESQQKAKTDSGVETKVKTVSGKKK